MPCRPRLGFGELRKLWFWRDMAVEVIVSAFFLMFLTFNQIYYFDEWKSNPTHVALVMTFIVFVMVEVFGEAQLSPGWIAIIFCRGKISLVKAVCSTMFQCIGAATGSGIVYGLTPESHRHVFAPFQPAEELGPYRALFLEMIIATQLFFVCVAVGDPKRPIQCNMPGLPIGCSVGVGILVAMSYTGAAMNPLIAFGPAVITGDFKHHWLYWVGSYSGAAIAAVVYFGLTSVKRDDQQTLNDVETKDFRARQGDGSSLTGSTEKRIQETETAGRKYIINR